MSTRFLERWLTFPAAIGFLVFYLVFLTSTVGKMVEPDIWWHLRNAQHLVQTHSFPRFDQYSFTAAGAPWIAHEWLSELAFYAAFRAFHLRGLLFLFAGLASAIFLALYYRCLYIGAIAQTASVVVVLGILIGTLSFGPRPLLFGWLCFMLLLLILDRFEKEDSALLWAIPPLFCLWINLHGSWIIGMVMLVLFVIAGSVEGEWGLVFAQRFTPAQLKKLILVVVTSVGALFLNPFGYRLVAYPFDLFFRQQLNLNSIDEWHSVDFHTPRGKLAMMLLLGLFVAGLASRRRWKLFEVASVAIALYFSLMYWRMQFFGVLVLVPIMATRLPWFPAYEPEEKRPLLNATLMTAAIILCFVCLPSEAQLNEQVWREYPNNALSFMRAHGLTERVLNDYEWGGYMIWRAPDIKTFIDGRADIFVYSGVFEDHNRIMRLQDSQQLLNRYRVQSVLLRPGALLTQLLDRDACWQKVYSDNLAVLYRRQSNASACAPQSLAGTQSAAGK